MRELQLFLQHVPVLTPISAERTFEVDAGVREAERMAQVTTSATPVTPVRSAAPR